MKKIVLILWVCLCLWLTPLHAFARAGGGGSSGSGGGGSSSHSTRHSSSARRMHPAASTIITISPFSLIALSKRYREIGPALKKHRQIKNQLPVDSHQLDDQVKEAYFALQNGWAQQNLEAMRPYLSPSLYTQWEGKLSWMKMRHEKNVLLDIELKHAISWRVEQDAG